MRHLAFYAGLVLVLGIGLTLSLVWLLQVPGDEAHAQSGTGIIRVAMTGSDARGCGGEADPCRTVQYAVDSAASGDEIRVAAGIYADVHGRPSDDFIIGGILSQVVYLTKTITLGGGYTTANWTTSDPNANPTILDGQGKGRGLYIAGDISPTIQGFQIIHGDAAGMGGDLGGGIYVRDATAHINNNQVSNNVAWMGGGLYLERSAARLERNTISSNFSTRNDGGGLYLSYSPAYLEGNMILSNSGGGIGLWHSAATLTRNTIRENTGVSGGGLSVSDSSAIIDRNVVILNTAGTGGGVHVLGGPVIINGNTIRVNTAWAGGGLWLVGSDATLTNNVVTGNQVTGDGCYGSGLVVLRSSVRAIHNTFARNRGGEGSGIYVQRYEWDGTVYPSTVTLTNTILVSHTVGITSTAGNTMTLEATLWGKGIWANLQDWDGPGTIVTGTVNIWDDPGFLKPDSGNYHITRGSAAVNRGIDAGVTTDIDGQLRPQGDGFDIGADEWPAWSIYLPAVVR